MVQWACEVGKRNGFVIIKNLILVIVVYNRESLLHVREVADTRKNKEQKMRETGTKNCACPFAIKGH